MIYLVWEWVINKLIEIHLLPIKIISFNHKTALEIKLQFVYCSCASNFIMFICAIPFRFDGTTSPERNVAVVGNGMQRMNSPNIK